MLDELVWCSPSPFRRCDDAYHYQKHRAQAAYGIVESAVCTLLDESANGRSSQAFWVHLSTGVGTFLEAVKLQKNMDVVVVFLFSKTKKNTGRESWRALFALLFPHRKGCSMQERMLEIDGEGFTYPLIPGSKIVDDVR
jgi:hypothetical protein